MLFMLMSKSRTNSKAENRESPRIFTGRASRGPFLQQFLHLPTVYQDLPGSTRTIQPIGSGKGATTLLLFRLSLGSFVYGLKDATHLGSMWVM
mmetsp:Transcript_88321/g.140516  ORF Transcript_88321/g.140516 Transcript_88321/m.140516 type:complete len:93 (+) Transcript_88321:186-464(+)